jgi:hypothetical protein
MWQSTNFAAVVLIMVSVAGSITVRSTATTSPSVHTHPGRDHPSWTPIWTQWSADPQGPSFQLALKAERFTKSYAKRPISEISKEQEHTGIQRKELMRIHSGRQEIVDARRKESTELCTTTTG